MSILRTIEQHHCHRNPVRSRKRPDERTSKAIHLRETVFQGPCIPWRTAFSFCTLFALAFCNLGCKSAPPPTAEKVPPSPVKWEGCRQLFLEEWTELVGTTQPLPDHAARVTSPVAGLV